MKREHLRLRLGLTLIATLGTGCPFEFTEQPRREHGSVGAEVFRVLCMGLAAQSFPNDLSGATFSATCSGTSSERPPELTPEGDSAARAYARLSALLERREKLVRALDVSFDSAAYRPDEMRDFISNMVPLYDPPQPIPEATRAVASLLQDLLDTDSPEGKEAVASLERISAREGYRPAPFDLALTRSVLRYPKLDEVVRTTLASIAKDGPAREAYEELLQAGVLDLATASTEAPDPQNPGTLSTSLDLLLRESDAYAGDAGPQFVTTRDVRGLALPQGSEDGTLPAPFQDLDGDGLADVDAQGRWLTADAQAPSPYPTFEQTPAMSVSRDASGRATDTAGKPIYASLDADRTFLAGVLREIGPLLQTGETGHAPLVDFAYGANALLGDYGTRSEKVGATTLSFQGPDTDKGPVFDFVHALTSTLPFAETDAFLEVTERLFREHEGAVAGLIEAILYIKERSHSYPDAVLEKPHDFWDQLLDWTATIGKHPELLERVVRALGEEDAAAAGPLMGNFMRYRDRVNHPFGSPEDMMALGIYPSTIWDADMKACTGRCGQSCSVSNPCGAGSACALNADGSGNGTCKSINEAVLAHRTFVNYPCSSPSQNLLGADSGKGCRPHVDHPSKNHKGMRNCPATKPQGGASCVDQGAVGLCSWDQGSCTCDCEGGLCRNGAQPTWRCTDTPTPGYADWVDRSQPDYTVQLDTANKTYSRSNQSLFQRTVGLVHNLHIPAKWCNKPNAYMNVYSTPGGTERLLGDIQLFGPYGECQLLEVKSIAETFGRCITGTAELDLGVDFVADLMGLLDTLGLDGMTPNDLMERHTRIRGMGISKPTPQGVARTVYGAPTPFTVDLLRPVNTRDKKLIIDTHPDTIMAWELEDPVSGASYYSALKPILVALDMPKADGTSYLYNYGDIITLAHRHWSSRASDETTRACVEGSSPLECDPSAVGFSYQTSLVHYEELIAEALVDAKLLSRLKDVVNALEQIQLSDGRDGVKVLVESFKNMLLPERSCVDAACTASLTTYRDGRMGTTTNTGHPLEKVGPLYLILDALNAIDARFEGAFAGHLKPWREARSRIVDTFFDIDRSAPEQWRFKSQRGRAILVDSVSFLRRRMAQYQVEQDACRAAGAVPADCHQVHDWAFGLTPRLAKSLSQPVSAAAMRLLERLRELDSKPLEKFTDLAAYLTTERADDETFAATLVAATDALQLLQDTKHFGPLMVFLARGIAPNAHDVVKGGAAQSLDIDSGSVERSLSLLRALQDVAPESSTEKSSLSKLAARFAESHEDNGESPLDVIIETIVAVNRATPATRGPLTQEDLRSMLEETAYFLSSKRHGLERLYEIVQSRELP